MDEFKRSEGLVMHFSSVRFKCSVVINYTMLIFQIEFDEKELRKEIATTIQNIHGIRSVGFISPDFLLFSHVAVWLVFTGTSE